jgi:hypothetical protein
MVASGTKAKTTAKAKANTGVLRYAQNDNIQWRGRNEVARQKCTKRAIDAF